MVKVSIPKGFNITSKHSRKCSIGLALSHTSKKFLFKTRTSNNQEYFLISEVSYSFVFLTFATRESAGVSFWPDRHGMRLEDFRGQKTEMSNICGWLTRGKKWLSQPAVAKTGS